MKNIIRVTLLIAVLVLIVGPAVFSDFTTYLLTYALIMAIAGLAVNVLLGYTGLMSFGHGMFIGAGAYTVALIMKYTGVHSFEVLIPMSVFISAALAAFVGLFCTRQIEIYFARLSLSCGELLYTLCVIFKTIRIDGLK